MRLFLNVIWLIFGGLWLALGYVLAALVCFVLIITIPFGIASLRIASYALWPFGRTIIDKPGVRPGAMIGNIIWVILCGFWLAIGQRNPKILRDSAVAVDERSIGGRGLGGAPAKHRR